MASVGLGDEVEEVPTTVLEAAVEDVDTCVDEPPWVDEAACVDEAADDEVEDGVVTFPHVAEPL